MKTNNNKGFTLIELIMVIVIMGILAAVAVPKFFDLTSQAHVKNKAAVIGNIKAGLNLYAANSLVTTGSRAFPANGTASLLTVILDEVPEGWTASSVVGTDSDTITYSGDNSEYEYDSDGSTFTITAL